ncbi:TSUP family transporter [Myxosarcina sp. GI1]|uniref:sulfite exporter TauE/SafE family protein n=1 Tax=Myxosarcina sp. GI1 TaxID=1541065 RepID=UPI00055D8A4E|nr:TSUP family transporter [Myxosarcina sp. GI1]
MILIVILLTGIIAGFVDAIAGGGGMIMIPGLIFSGLPVATAIATNKLCGTCGVLTSSIEFARSQQVDWQACIYMGIPAVFGSWLGSRSIGFLPTAWAEPIVILLMVAITLFVVFKPDFGLEKSAHVAIAQSHSSIQILKLACFGAIIGFHDGFFGPGAGTFLVFALVYILSLDFLRGTGTAKVINFMTNLIALISFWLLGMVSLPEGIAGALGVGVGAYIGSTVATVRGAKFIKPIFITVTTVLVGKLLWEYLEL